MTVDASGNAVVTGSSASGSGEFGEYVFDYYTAKYAAADGFLIWEKTYNGPANGDDALGRSHCLALGPNGMVAITGSSDGNYGPGVTPDYATVVYREILPSISIARSNAFVMVSWLVTGRSLQLQESTYVSLPDSWSPVAQAAVTNGGQISVAVPIAVGSMFFRLKSQ